MGLRKYHYKIRVQVPTDSGYTRLYVSPDKAELVEQEQINLAVAHGTRFATIRNGTLGGQVKSTSSLLLKDGRPRYFGIWEKKKMEACLLRSEFRPAFTK